MRPASRSGLRLIEESSTMGRNIVQKVLEQRLVAGKCVPGSEIAISVDHTLLHDIGGPMALMQFEAMGMPRVRTKRSVVYIDHNTLQTGFENPDDHRFLESAARKFGLHVSRAGNGICHQVNLERFSVPGDVLLGCDSHTATAGGVGMFAFSAGGLDVAVAMAGVPFYLKMPVILKVAMNGSLQPWSTAKDVVLEVVRRLTVSGGRGKVLEFGGDGVAALSVTERATIANMCIETGALSGIFPSDEMTRRYLRAQGREADWREVKADADATYDEVMEIDLSALPPLIARPHLPDNVVAVAEEAGRKVDQVAIGSCTNSSLEDMLKVAAILKGGRVPPGVSLVIAPGSRQVLLELMERGALADMVRAGARVLEIACGPCIGMGHAPSSGGVSLRTFNRNFQGRSGTADAQVYLVSPETAAVSALAGVITDPRTRGEPVSITLPERLTIDDALIVAATERDQSIELLRGPNIKALPEFPAMPAELGGKVLLTVGDNITTDDIMPAGAQITALRSNIPAISKYVFSRLDRAFAVRAEAAGGGIIIGGKNYGQGSAREHAALAPRYLGVRAVIAESFARIHKSNLINFGILPLEFENSEDGARFSADDDVILVNARQHLADGATRFEVCNTTRGVAVHVTADISARSREILRAGGLLPFIKTNFGKTTA